MEEEGLEDVVVTEVVVVAVVVEDLVVVVLEVVCGVVGSGLELVVLFLCSCFNLRFVFCWNLFHQESVVLGAGVVVVGEGSGFLEVEVVLEGWGGGLVVVRGEVEDSVVVIWFHQVLGKKGGVGKYWLLDHFEWLQERWDLSTDVKNS